VTRGRGAAAAAGLALLLAGCAGGLAIDNSHRAVSQGPRVDLLVIHYTALDLPTSLRVLTQQEVSSHYLVGDDPPTLYRLVDEDRRANHAGESAWQRRSLLNASSIGIEIVNPGYVDGPAGRRWAPYPPQQIDAVIALVRDITRRWGISPDRVVGHSDIAPGRKPDPGPLFPWKRLADEGLALWYDEALAAALQPRFQAALPAPDWFRQRLSELGYRVAAEGESEPSLHDVLVAFQMHFRPARHDGVPDAETAAILAALSSR
jgi:N-acetylmuramoyl-L-alanine amidase